MDQALQVNRDFWDEVAPHHAASDFYAVESFVAGHDPLGEIEVAEVGDVRGATFVHLQCHIGLDTLSWARRGARVTGVDFSAGSLRIARDLAGRIGVPARFVESDVAAAPDVLRETYDFVFASRGVLMWIGDLDGWAGACARLLKPGGVFYLLDIHPLGMALEQTDGGLRLSTSYFTGAEPNITNADASYAVRDVGLVNTETREWIHPVGDVVSALIRPESSLNSCTNSPPIRTRRRRCPRTISGPAFPSCPACSRSAATARHDRHRKPGNPSGHYPRQCRVGKEQYGP